jgi:hypothetical protein
MFSRREFLQRAASLVIGGAGAGSLAGCVNTRANHGAGKPCFQTRGAVVVVKDMQTLDWPALAKEAGLTTLATHIKPSEIAAFVQTEPGHRFLESCRRHGLEVEHELHALEDLLPRSLFEQDKTMFRMDDKGERVRDWNLCVHSAPALEVAAENSTRYTRLLRSTTGRYFYWIDDGMPMCRCPKCHVYSDSDQALIFENHIWRAIRRADPRARLAHLAYTNTLTPPQQVKPEPGIFLEFAPIERHYDTPFSRREAKGPRGILHVQMLDALDANLEWFGRDGAQVLEYWLDVSLIAGWKRETTVKIPWNEAVFRDDLGTYARRGIRRVTSFAAWLDGDYARRWGVAPVHAYGAGWRRWRRTNGQPQEQA